jgi:glycosyltransferase involved in cell wall biosynthesis
MRRVPTVLEVNSDDLAEYRLYLPRYQYLHHRATRERTLRHAAGFVAMTHELAGPVEKYGRPVAVIANGIELDDFASLPASADGPPRLVFMGAPLSSWHGVDNLVALARARPGVQVELVGTDPDPAFPPNVNAHGFLPRRSYEAVHARCDAGVGTLGLYRKEMSEACPLKVREYLAMGLPAVIGYRDTDFPRPVPFILEIPNREGNAAECADAIVAFCEKWRGRRVERSHIRHLDVSLKERERLSFLAQLAG